MQPSEFAVRQDPRLHLFVQLTRVSAAAEGRRLHAEVLRRPFHVPDDIYWGHSRPILPTSALSRYLGHTLPTSLRHWSSSLATSVGSPFPSRARNWGIASPTSPSHSNG